jgi:hemerythrin-like domain-containing protein
LISFGKGLKNDEEKIGQYKKLLKKMPESHRETLLRLLKVLRLVVDHQNETRMNSDSLAKVVAPSLIRATNLVYIENFTNLVRHLIDSYELLKPTK